MIFHVSFIANWLQICANLIVILSIIHLYLCEVYGIGFRIQVGEELLNTGALVNGWRLDQAARRHVSCTREI